MSDLKLGQPVKVRAVVEVQKQWKNDGGKWGGGHAIRVLVAKPRECTGIMIGKRTMYEGWNDYMGDDGIAFIRTAHREVYLVALSMRQMVRAFPEDVDAE